MGSQGPVLENGIDAGRDGQTPGVRHACAVLGAYHAMVLQQRELGGYVQFSAPLSERKTSGQALARKGKHMPNFGSRRLWPRLLAALLNKIWETNLYSLFVSALCLAEHAHQPCSEARAASACMPATPPNGIPALVVPDPWLDSSPLGGLKPQVVL